jgi:fatty acid desaturase
MIILGIVLLIIGLLTGIPIVWSIGVIVLVIGLVLWLLGAMGHAVAGGTTSNLRCRPLAGRHRQDEERAAA